MVERHSQSNHPRFSAVLSILLLLLAASVHVHLSVHAQDPDGLASDASPSTASAVSSARPGTVNIELVRVANAVEGEVVQVLGPNYSSFNLDSTRFLLDDVDGRAVLYSFDPISLDVKREGSLLEGLRLADCQWSAYSKDRVFGMSLNQCSEAPPQILGYNVETRIYSIVKDFSGVIPGGLVEGLSKARIDDDHFAFTWRESALSPWRYVVVWDKLSDATHVFDISDPLGGMPSYRDAFLDASGTTLIVRGFNTKAWHYLRQPQAFAASIDSTSSGWERTEDILPTVELDASGEVWDQGPRRFTFYRDRFTSPWDVLPYQSGNRSRDGHFFIFNARDNGVSGGVFIATQETTEALMDKVTWTNVVNCDATDNTLEKTSGNSNAEDAGGMSLQSVESGDGFVEFVASEKTSTRACGFLSTGISPPTISDYDYAIQLVKKKAFAYENGIVRAKIKYKAKSTFRLAVEGDVVKYYKNGKVFYTSGKLPLYPLICAASIISAGASVTSAMMSGAKVHTRVFVRPKNSNLNDGASERFSATVSGSTNPQVTWTATGGSITGDGSYTAPLTPGRYEVTATSLDDTNASATASVEVSNSDSSPPLIGGVVVNAITSNSALVTWGTDEPSDSQVDYGLTEAYGMSTPLDSLMVTGHSVQLSGLSPSSVYHFRVRSSDAAGNLAASSDYTFETITAVDVAPPVISAVSSSGISSTSATISWLTDEASDTQVEYGTSVGYGASTTLITALITSHSAFLGSLSASTVYHCRVKSRDAAGNLAVSGDFIFATGAAPDITPPVISNVFASDVSGGGATISWTTDEASDSQVEYGTTTAYGASSALKTALLTSHGVSLTGLSATTLYHYRVKSRDAAGNLATSNDFAFTTTTPPDTTPPAISGISSSGVTSSVANISWATNEASDSQVDYGISSAYELSSALNISLVTSHAVLLSGLSPSTVYHYRVKSRDAAGNLATSGDLTFTSAAPPDTTPPVISGISSSGVTSSSASISWATDEASDSQVDFGASTSYGSSSPLNTNLGTSHSLLLSGLSASTLYHYRVKSRDGAGNLAISGDFTFTTQAPPDTTPPVISGVSSSGVTSNGATVSWTTNEASDTQVDYGTSTSYGSSTPSNSSPVTSHSAVLTGLSASTLYHYRVKSRDAAGNLATSGDFTFTTQASADTTPPVIGSVASSGVTSSTATVTWSTNEASDSQVQYDTNRSYGSSSPLDTAMVTSHSVSLSGLSPGSLYHYRVLARDPAGNLATSGDFTFTTTVAPDTTPPVISGVSSSGITSSVATISWGTDEASDTQVDYGTTTGYGSSTPLNTSLVTSHSAGLTGLSANTLYHYRVKSRDAAGNLATSSDFTFTTAAAPDTTPPVISGVASSGVTSSAATISWATNEASDTQVDYGTTTAYGSSSPLNTSLVTSHNTALSGLSGSTTYHYRVKSRDAAGNLAASGDFMFTTQPASDTTPPVISSVSSSGVTSAGAAITWSTNEASNTQVEYGTTIAYGSSTPLNSTLVTSHSASLSGLSASTLYHYRVKSRDAAGNLATSGDFTFTTATPAAATIVVDPGTSYQTINGWEAHAQSGEIDFPSNFAVYGPTLLDAAVEAGINRVRLELWGDIENTTEDANFASNDDGDPNHYNPSGFSWSRFDTRMNSVIVPLRNRLIVKGESLYINLCYVDFLQNGHTFYHANDPAEYAEFILAGFDHMQSGWGFVPDAVEIILEPDAGNNVGRWTAAKVAANLVAAQSRLAAAGYHPRFILPSVVDCTQANTWYDGVKAANPSAIQYVDELSYHRYTNCNATELAQNRDAAEADGNRLSMLEWWNSGNSYLYLHEDLGATANGVAWEGGVIAYPNQPDNGGPLFLVSTSTNSVTIASRTKFYRQYFKYIRPGAVRKGAIGNSTFDPLAFLNTNGRWAVVVKCSTGGAFTIGGLPAGTYGVFYTTATAYDQHPPNQTIATGQNLSVSIPAAGVLTVFTDAAPVSDTTAPVISAVSSSAITSSGATINWSTNEASDTQVEYGLSSLYGASTALNSSMVTSHSSSLGSLLSGTLYHYRVKSRDAAGNLALSGDFTFTTSVASDTTPPVISGVSTSGVTSSGATVTWTTNEVSDTQVEYGTTTGYGSTTGLDPSLATSHSAILSGMSAGTVYHYRVKSRDAAGNLAVSGDFTFTTSAAPPPTGASFYVALNGSPSGNGNINSPWNLQTALNQPSVVQPGATIYLRGGTYNGKFTSNLNGTSTAPITVRSYPGEMAKIDGYLHSTLAGALAAAAGDPVTVVINNSAIFNDPTTVMIDQEIIYLSRRQSDGKTWINCARGWSGTTPAAHSVGADAHDDSNVLTINGGYTYFRDFEVFSSNPTRAFNFSWGGLAPQVRGQGITVNPSTGIKLINLVIHDNREGIFAGEGAIDTEVYGCIIFNNGFVDWQRGHGLGIYMLNQTGQKKIRNVISFNGFVDGMKAYSESQHAQNFLFEHVISFNNGVLESYPGNPGDNGVGIPSDYREANIFAGTGNSNNPINNILVHSSYLYHPPDVTGTMFRAGYQGIGATGFELMDSRIMGGGSAVMLAHFSGAKVTGNKFYAQRTTPPPGGFVTLVDAAFETGYSAVWDNNTYLDQLPVYSGIPWPFRFAVGGTYKRACDSGTVLKFTEAGCSPNGGWRELTSFDASSTWTHAAPTGAETFVIPNEYEPGRAHIAIYNWSLAGSVAVDLSGVLNVGDTYAVYAAENYLGVPVVTGVYGGSAVQVPMTGTIVMSPIGLNWTPKTVRPQFGAFVVRKQ
jgi:phosphodiesterase/alkaline phosphatase D-like protein